MNQPDSCRAQPLAGGLRRRLDNLGVKLFLAIAGANLVLVMAVYLGYSVVLDQGLVDYVNRSEQARLRPIIEQLADGYEQHGSWKWLEDDRDEWYSILRSHLGWQGAPFISQRSQRAGGAAQNGLRGGAPSPASPSVPNAAPTTPSSSVSGSAPASAPAPVAPARRIVAPTITIDWRIMLFDSRGAVAIPYPFSDAATLAQARKLPITVNNVRVGYLGYIPRLTLVESMEFIAKQQQSKRFVVIAIGMLAAVLLNAALISHWLSRRLRALGQGATALARGDYAARIPVLGHDEVARLAGDFNHLAQALEAAQRGRQQWIADIAHELRTPLTSLRAEVEALQDGVRPLTQASMVSVAQEVHQLTRIVEDLRLLSLSDLGALTCRKQPLQLSEALEDALLVGRAGIEDKGLQVQVQADASIMVEADPDRLAQLFGNLLQNTLRYTESPASLVVTAQIDGPQVRVDWEDSPPGVADEDLPRLTERLFRVDASRNRASGGTGLGLAIVKAIVDAHGGRMQAGHSRLGGLRWSIWLPLSES